jgi:hypothetical protein
VTRRGVAAPLLLAVACGGDVAAPPVSDLEKACADYASAQCEKDDECRNGQATQDSTRVRSCARFETAHCLRRSTFEGLNEKEDQIAACSASIRKLDCTQFISGVWPNCFPQG